MKTTTIQMTEDFEIDEQEIKEEILADIINDFIDNVPLSPCVSHNIKKDNYIGEIRKALQQDDATMIQ